MPSLDIPDEQITIMTQPKKGSSRIFARFLPFQVNSPNNLLKLLHETDEVISTGRSNYGPLAEYFESKINDCIEDTEFLFDNLQNEWNAGEYIGRRFGSARKEVISFTRILPILVICTSIQEETESGTHSHTDIVLYERDTIFIDVISSAYIQNLIEIANKEFSDLLEWLSTCDR